MSPLPEQPEQAVHSHWKWLFFFVLLGVAGLLASHWERASGFSSLLHFGTKYESQRLTELRTLSIPQVRGAGYDGQFYAQMAVRLDPRDKELQAALDNPSYRSRRILIPALAHSLGFAGARVVVDAFVLLHFAAWVLAAWCLWQLLKVSDREGFFRWACCVLGLGALDSLRLGLPDVPSLALALGGVLLWQRGRGVGAVGLLALAGMARETIVLSFPALFRQAGKWRALAAIAAACAVPAVWILWIQLEVRNGSGGLAGNFDLPGFSLVRHLRLSGADILTGDPSWRSLFGFLGALGLAWQSIWLISRFRREDPWLRFGLGSAILFWFLGGLVWEGYWAVARSCLPMTVAFCVSYPRGRWSLPVIAACNLSVVHALMRLVLNA